MTCPTQCDDDCETFCHEAHEVYAKRLHDVEACREGRLELTDLGVWLASERKERSGIPIKLRTYGKRN